MRIKLDAPFDANKALLSCGRKVGICYSTKGYDSLRGEPTENTKKRVKNTLSNFHHSTYDHVSVTLDCINMPKILCMILNNEKMYTASEKSGRYTPVIKKDGITDEEIHLYHKWMDILSRVIEKEYGHIFDANSIKKLAQENARYMISVFTPTELIYTVPWAQLNRIASWMIKFIDRDNKSYFEKKIDPYLEDFLSQVDSLKILNSDLMSDSKNRSLSLFSERRDFEYTPNFGETYCTTYQASFAQLAQAQRHRTLDYKMCVSNIFFIPPIILFNDMLVNNWYDDISSISDLYPQGNKVNVLERGTYEMFILKCKERLCSRAQLEIMQQTRKTLFDYADGLKVSKNVYLSKDISNYLHGARCTFPDYLCKNKCNFPGGVNCTRSI